MDNIFSQIRQEQKDFYSSWIEVVPGYSFNQYETLKRSHLYLNSKFENGMQYLGRDKIFFNIVNAPCEVAAKMLNIDTKNIRLWPLNPKSEFSTYLLEKELKTWLKTSKMGQILNQIADEAPKYGSVFIEKIKGGATVLDLRKVVNDQTVDRVKDSRFIDIIYYMTPTELRDTGWDNVEEAIERFGNPAAEQGFEDNMGNYNQQLSTPFIKVVKRYGEVPQWWVDGGRSEKLVRSLFIVAGADYLQKNDEGIPIEELGLVLFKSRWYKEWPIKDFHYTKIKGRLLGLGIPEMLADVQARINELKNQKRISMELSTIHIFTTADKTVVRNVLTDLQSGDVLQSKSGISPLENEERNLSAFESEEQSYMMQADRMSFATESLRGELPPASTPATSAILANQSATSVYAFKRENLAIFLQDFFNDLVIPELMKDLTAEHIMRFSGTSQELQKIDMAAAEIFANDFIMKRMLSGKPPRPEEVEVAKQGAMLFYQLSGENRFINIKKQLYTDTEFEFDFNIVNEQDDPATIVANTKDALATLASNPNILQDPRLKLLFSRYAQAIGIPQAELDLADQQATALLANQQANEKTNQNGGNSLGQSKKQAVPTTT